MWRQIQILDKIYFNSQHFYALSSYLLMFFSGFINPFDAIFRVKQILGYSLMVKIEVDLCF